MAKAKRVLISGFEAFAGASSNPSAMLCEALRDWDPRTLGGVPVELATVILPVTFEGAFAQLKAELIRFQPEIVLAIGQAGGREGIEFERVAVNCIDAEIPDNQGRVVRDQEISPEGPAAYFSRLPLRSLVAALSARGIPSRISNSAGLYVCNLVFYKLMEFLNGRTMAGFIHVPYLPDQAAEAERRHALQPASTGGAPPGSMRFPSLTFATQLEGLQAAVELLVKMPSS